jgi:hypothetical protein
MKFNRLPLLAFLCLLFCSETLFAQNTFQKTIGGDGEDIASWVTEIPNGFIVAGLSTTLNSDQNACLIQLDNAGNLIWQKQYGTSTIFSVVLDEGDGYIALGASFGLPNVDILLVRTDLAGNTLWSKNIGDSSTTDLGLSLVQVPNGYLVSGAQAPTGSLNFNSFLTRLDANGNTLWSQTYNSGTLGNLFLSNFVENDIIYASGTAEGAGVFLRLDLANGDILSSSAYDGNSDTEALTFQQPTQDGNLVISDQTRSALLGNQMNPWVQKISKTNGQTIWSKIYSKPGINLRGRIEQANNGFLLMPFSDSTSVTNDGMLAKIDPDGNVLWSYQYGGILEERFIKAIQTSDGGFLAVGQSRSNSINGDNDIFVVKTDSNGLVTNCCIRAAGIQAFNYSPQDTMVDYDISNSHSADSIGINAVNISLINESFCISIPPIDTQSITLCPNETFTLDSITYNAPGVVRDTIPGIGGGCDTILVYNLLAAPFVSDSQLIRFCIGDSILIAGQFYTQSGTVLDTLPSAAGCDTLVTYTLEAVLQFTQSATIELCPGDSVIIAGQVYTQAGMVVDTISGAGGGCDTIATYNVVLLSQPTINDTITFCNGDSITIGGQVYTQSGTVTDTISSSSGFCDTIATYVLELLAQPTQNDTIQFCPGDTITIAGQVYTQSGTVTDTISSSSGFCDTIATYVLELLAQPTQNDTIQFCPGDTITIGGQVYTQSGTVTDTISSSSGFCDTIATYVLELLVQPTLSDTIELCAGDTITINGIEYTQPGTVLDTISAIGGGCDTLVTYVLISPTLAPSSVDITCPNNVTVITLPGTGPIAVNYNLPTVTSDCPCPGAALTLTTGLAPGSIFPVITTPVCYTATDSCGNTASCCFSVTIREEQPCDEKVAGCMKYEILQITKNAAQQHTYTIRVTNNCSNKMIWTAVRIPNGLVAEEPANNSVFTTPDGRNYDVRNPNFSPFYSVRFKSTADSISGGQSDIFKYTLPAQAGNVNYIYMASRLTNNLTYEAHMNTSNCPVTNQRPAVERIIENNSEFSTLKIFPNPTSGMLYADFSAWQDERLQVRIINSQGQLAQNLAITASGAQQQIALREGLADGLYFIEILTESGDRQRVRFVLQH